jgi:hypothetical protein
MRAQQVVVEARQFSLFEAVDLPRITSRLRSCEAAGGFTWGGFLLTAKLVRCGDSSSLDLRAPHFTHICAPSLHRGISSRLHDCG